MSTLTDRFRSLHEAGTFMVPNPWDLGSARYLEWRGFAAVATTSSGFAATLGRSDQHVTRDELVAHVETLTAGLSIPVTVDAERCYADDPGGVATTARLLADAGAAGFSLEDYDPVTGEIGGLAEATERVAIAAEEARRQGLVLTARTERHLYGGTGVDETVERLTAFRDAGAEVVYAPGLIDPDGIGRVVAEVGAPVNVLASVPGTPSVPELEAIGVRRVSTGGALAWAALGGLRAAVDELLATGTSNYLAETLSRQDRAEIFKA